MTALCRTTYDGTKLAFDFKITGDKLDYSTATMEYPDGLTVKVTSWQPGPPGVATKTSLIGDSFSSNQPRSFNATSLGHGGSMQVCSNGDCCILQTPTGSCIASMVNAVRFSITTNPALCGPPLRQHPMGDLANILLTEERKGVNSSTCLVHNIMPGLFTGGWNVKQTNLSNTSKIAFHDTLSMEMLPPGSTLDSDSTWIGSVVGHVKQMMIAIH
jgi:hypothetical protein